MSYIHIDRCKYTHRYLARIPEKRGQRVDMRNNRLRFSKNRWKLQIYKLKTKRIRRSTIKIQFLKISD